MPRRYQGPSAQASVDIRQAPPRRPSAQQPTAPPRVFALCRAPVRLLIHREWCEVRPVRAGLDADAKGASSANASTRGGPWASASGWGRGGDCNQDWQVAPRTYQGTSVQASVVIRQALPRRPSA